MSQDVETAAVLVDLKRAVAEALPGGAPETDTPRVGYFCSYVPPELMLAAGLIPVRMNGIGVDDSSTGDAYMSHLTCSYARHAVTAVVDGHYDFLEGQVSVNTCDHIRMANEVLKAKSDLGYHGFMTVPRNPRADLLAWYREEIGLLCASMAEHFGTDITDASLKAAIQRMNEVRERVSRLDELRRRDPPLLSGADAHAAFVAARVLVPESFVELADRLIEAAGNSDPIEGIRARVILYGGELDDPGFIRVIESQGAHVAGDLLCFGARGIGAEIEAADDPMGAIARAYLGQVPCARMMGEFETRYRALRALVKDAGASGVIFQRIKFCQIWSNEVHNLMHRFEKAPLPMLVLDREYGTVSTGQIKTRVQGFLERLGA